MNCRETEGVIHGYLDGELDLVRSLAVEQHLQVCPVCAQAHREWRSLRTALTTDKLYFNIPEGLQQRVRSAVRQAAGVSSKVETPRWRWNLNWSAIFAPLAAAAVMLLVAVPLATRHSTEENLRQEIVSAHVRSLMADTAHLTDVASSDQHTVKPWFTGKLAFAPPVTDFSPQGFALVGGRLDYVGEHPVAALVYQRRKHLINLFIWPEHASSNIELRTLRGYNLVHWHQGGMAHWAVSDVNPGDLRELQRLVSGEAASK